MKKATIDSFATVAFGANAASADYSGTFLVFVLALAAVVRNWQRRQLQPVHLVLLLGASYLVLQGYRFSSEFALLSLPLLAGGAFAERRSWRPALATLVVCCLSGFLWYGVAKSWISDSRGAYPLAFNNFPYGSCAFLEKVAPPGGKVYNTPNYGGLFLWRLGERHRIMMDMELQALFRDDDFFANRTASIDPKAFAVFVQRYQPDWLAFESRRHESRFLRESPDFVPVSFDDSVVLLVDRRQHPEIAEKWGLKAIDPWRAKLDSEYRLSPEAVAEAERLYEIEPHGLRLPALLAQAALGRDDLPAAEKLRRPADRGQPRQRRHLEYGQPAAAQTRRPRRRGGRPEKALLRSDPDGERRTRGPLAHLLARLGERKEALEQLRRRGPIYDPVPLLDLELEVELLEELGPPAEAAAARRILELRRGKAAF